jgi:hypothetical protein
MDDMRKDTKDRKKRLQKNFIKNEFLFATHINNNEDFLNRILDVSFYFFPEGAQNRFSGKNSLPGQYFGKRNEIRKLDEEIVNTLSTERKMNFYLSLHKILSDFHLGKEWLSTLICFAVSGIILPPVFNLAMSQEIVMPTADDLQQKSKSKKWAHKARVMLILNPDTTLTDVQDAWNEIRTFQKVSWPGFKGFVFDSKAIIRYSEVQKAAAAKADVPDDEKYEKLSEYEILLAKQHKNDSTAGRKAILQYRSKTGKKSKKLKIKKKMTDLELAKQGGFKGKTAVREAANIRQRRHRNKKVTPSLH